MKLRYVSVALISLALTSCTQPISEPIGEPFKVVVQAVQDPTNAKSAILTALIESTARGSVPSVVEFIDGTTVLATTSEKVQITPTNDQPWDLKASKSVTIDPGKSYRIRAKVSWTHKGISKILESIPINFSLTP